MQKAGQRPVPVHSIQNVGGPQVGVIYGKTLLTVPIGPPNSPRHPPEGARPACPSLDAAAHNFSSFHFQEAIRPVLKSSDRALCHEHTSSLVRPSARKKNLVQLKSTVVRSHRFVFLRNNLITKKELKIN